MKKRSKYILAGAIIGVFLIAFLHFADAKTFKGRVIDADTKEPIEGAVVVIYWYKATATITGDSTTLKDVKECLTDKNGEWSITGPKGRPHNPNPLFSLFTGTYYTREPQFIVFKPGYCSWPNGFDIDSCKGRIKPGGNGEISEGKTVELPKDSGKDRRGSLPHPIDELERQKEFWAKQRLFLKLLNEERVNIGLDKY